MIEARYLESKRCHAPAAWISTERCVSISKEKIHMRIVWQRMIFSMSLELVER